MLSVLSSSNNVVVFVFQYNKMFIHFMVIKDSYPTFPFIPHKHTDFFFSLSDEHKQKGRLQVRSDRLW